MKAHKLTLLIVDHDDVGEEIPNILENQKYPNHCISPHVMSMETVDIGEWNDDHPLNIRSEMKNHCDKIFDGRNTSLVESLLAVTMTDLDGIALL